MISLYVFFVASLVCLIAWVWLFVGLSKAALDLIYRIESMDEEEDESD